MENSYDETEAAAAKSMKIRISQGNKENDTQRISYDLNFRYYY